MLKSMSYKGLKDIIKFTPTCFGSQRILHQGVITCTVTGITCSVSQIFFMCVVGVRRHILKLWCMCALRRAVKYCTFRPVVAHTYTTFSEYAVKHRPRTWQIFVNHYK